MRLSGIRRSGSVSYAPTTCSICGTPLRYACTTSWSHSRSRILGSRAARTRCLTAAVVSLRRLPDLRAEQHLAECLGRLDITPLSAHADEREDVPLAQTMTGWWVNSRPVAEAARTVSSRESRGSEGSPQRPELGEIGTLLGVTRRSGTAVPEDRLTRGAAARLENQTASAAASYRRLSARRTRRRRAATRSDSDMGPVEEVGGRADSRSIASSGLRRSSKPNHRELVTLAGPSTRPRRGLPAGWPCGS